MAAERRAAAGCTCSAWRWPAWCSHVQVPGGLSPWRVAPCVPCHRCRARGQRCVFLPQLVGGSGMWAVLLLQGGGCRARVPFPELPGPLAAEKAEILSWHLGDAAVLAKRLSPADMAVCWGKHPSTPSPNPALPLQTSHGPGNFPRKQEEKEESFISKTKVHFANQNYKE